MFKKKKKDDILKKWLPTIHDDLYHIKMYLMETKTNNNSDTYEQLKGLRNAILLDACSGIAYLYNGKIYNSLEDIIDEGIDEDIIRVMNVDYLLQFIDQILE